ncbi:MAG: PDZ domain-containing protein [Planctomycetes bacterium]|nr:PDZ domain-containing protein [Planctomycetota bacterium]
MYKHKALFVIKLALVLILGYVVIITVLMPQRTGEILVPSSAVGTEHITAVKPASFPDTPVDDYSVIVEQDIFGSSLRTNKSLLGDNGLGPALSAEEELGIALLGTVAGSPEISRAIIKDLETNVLSLYKIGDTVATAHIESIEKDVVVLIHQGQRKILELGTRESAARPPVDKRHDADNVQGALSRNAAQAAETNPPAKSLTTAGAKLSDIEIMLTKAIIEPYMIDGQVEGLKITGLENIREAENLGLKNGDIIRTVNGHRLTSKQKAYQIFKKARSQEAMNIELLRDNETKTLSFSLR